MESSPRFQQDTGKSQQFAVEKRFSWADGNGPSPRERTRGFKRGGIIPSRDSNHRSPPSRPGGEARIVSFSLSLYYIVDIKDVCRVYFQIWKINLAANHSASRHAMSRRSVYFSRNYKMNPRRNLRCS